jgi:hypothetical protein
MACVLGRKRFRETFHHLVHYPFNQVGEFLLQKHVEIVVLALHDLCEILSCQGLEVLMHIHGTFGMFRTF